TTFRYNPFHQALEKLSPTSDEEGSGRGRNLTTYQYDQGGNLIGSTDRDNRQASYSYDPLNRRTAETWYGPTPKGQTIGGVTAQLAYGYDATNNLVFAQNTNTLPDNTNGSYTYAYTYEINALNQVTGVQAPLGQAWQYRYDAIGNRLWEWEQTGKALATSTYDNANRLTGRTLNSGVGTLARVALSYGPQDQLLNVKRFSYSTSVFYALQSQTSTAFDAAGRLVGQDDTEWLPNSKKFATISEAEYGYSAAGLVREEYRYGWDDRKQSYPVTTLVYANDKTGQLL